MSNDLLFSDFQWKLPISKELLTDKNIDSSSLRLYLVLLSYARDKVSAFPSRETLAKDLDCSARNIDLLKQKLKDNNLLTWETKIENNKKKNIYKILRYSHDIQNDSYKFEKIIKIFCEQYHKFCTEGKKEVMEMVHNGWIEMPNYTVSDGDYKNLKMFYEHNGDIGLKKIEIAFSFLCEYMNELIYNGEFYDFKGQELTPTISLFLKAKVQLHNLLDYTKRKLKERR